MPPKTPKIQQVEGNACAHTDCLQMMQKMIDSLANLIKTTHEKQMEVLQCEIFTLKKELDVEISKREKSKEETANIRKEVKHLNESFSYTIERLDCICVKNREHRTKLQNGSNQYRGRNKLIRVAQKIDQALTHMDRRSRYEIFRYIRYSISVIARKAAANQFKDSCRSNFIFSQVGGDHEKTEQRKGCGGSIIVQPAGGLARSMPFSGCK